MARDPGAPVFIGTAQSDTILAGPGTVHFHSTESGHVGRGEPRLIFGQLVHVGRISDWPAAAREALGRAGNEAVLVPWDFDSLCDPVRWSPSARWMTPGQSGLFLYADLRDRAHWAGNRPTFDVHNVQSSPYTDRLATGDTTVWRGPPARDPWLTPNELLDFYSVLPPYGSRSATPTDTEYVALAPLRQWMRDHPQLARRQPAARIIHDVGYYAEVYRVEAITSPIAGTYRFTVIAPGADTIRLFVRTGIHPVETIQTASGDDPIVPDGQIARAEGYMLLAQGAQRVDELSTTRYGRTGHPLEGGIGAGERPVLVTRDSVVWLGTAEISRILNALDPRFAAQQNAINAAIGALFKDHKRTYLPGRFVRTRNGSVTYEEIARRDGLDLLVVRGERISTTTVSQKQWP